MLIFLLLSRFFELHQDLDLSALHSFLLGAILGLKLLDCILLSGFEMSTTVYLPKATTANKCLYLIIIAKYLFMTCIWALAAVVWLVYGCEFGTDVMGWL